MIIKTLELEKFAREKIFGFGQLYYTMSTVYMGNVDVVSIIKPYHQIYGWDIQPGK